MTTTQQSPGGAPGAETRTPKFAETPELLAALEENEGLPITHIDQAEPEEDPDTWADVLASRLLRALRAVRARLTSYDALEKKEVALLEARFAHLKSGEERSASALEAGLLNLAKQVTFPRGKKSRSVGAGRYGLKTKAAKAAKFAVKDKDAALAWFKAKAPDLLTATPTITYSMDLDKAAAAFLESGDPDLIPAGCELLEAVPEEQTLNVAFAEEGE